MTGTKNRIYRWGAWVERWFVWEVDVTKVIYTELHFIWGSNKNKGEGDYNSTEDFYLKGIPKNTIDGARVSVGANHWKGMSIF